MWFPAAWASTISLNWRPATWLITEMTPAPPSPIIGSVSSSSPDRTSNPSGAPSMIVAVWEKSAFACLSATMFSTSCASRRIVAGSMLITQRPGMLYRITGQLDRLGDRAEVQVETLLRRLVVVRDDGHDPVDPEACDLAREIDRVRRAVVACVRDDGNPPADGLDDGSEQLDLLGVEHRG